MVNKLLKLSLITIISVILLSFKVNSQSFQWVANRNHTFSINPDMTSFNSHSDINGNSVISDIQLYKLYYGQNIYGDVSLKRYNSTGNLISGKILLGKIFVSGIQTDNKGNVYLAGNFMDTLVIDSGNKLFNTGSGFNLNYFLIKLNSDLNFIWSKNITAIYGQYYAIDEIKIKKNFLYAGILDFTQGFLKKFDLNGSEVFSIVHYPVRGITGIDEDNSGNIFTAGSCGIGSINFGGTIHNAPHAYNIYLSKFNPSGNNEWTKFVEDVTFSETDIVCDNSNNLIACGDLNGSFFFGNIQAQGTQWVYDFFVTKLNSSGEFLWLKEVPNNATITGDAGKGKSSSIATDKDDNVYMSGFFRGSIDFGNNVMVSTTGYKDIMILKYDKNGIPAYVKKAGGSGSNRTDCISVNKFSELFISGNYYSNAVFDTIIAPGSGSINSFITKISPDNPYSILQLRVIQQGFYNPGKDNLRMNDTVHVYLRNSASPYAEIDHSTGIADKNTFEGTHYFHNAGTGNYFLQIKHRNSIETWSANPVHFENVQSTDYDFTVSQDKAYGNNLVRVKESPVRFALFSGDVNQDGIIDASDMTGIDNDSFNFMSGYISTDITGDGICDAADAATADNNAAQFVGKIVP